MENSRAPITQLTTGLLLVCGISLPQFAHAYARDTHKGLTEATVKAYEQTHGDIFSITEQGRMIQGSWDEDDSWRFMRHFFDPVNNRGLVFAGSEYLASKIWAQDTEGQGNYNCLNAWMCAGKHISYNDKFFSSPTDFSWDRAIYEYAWGDKERAVETLGHILHLIQDATVPAHVRNDAHPSQYGIGDGDPYEGFSSQFREGQVPVPSELEKVSFPGIGHALDAVAGFANKNFVSKDTLFVRYALPDQERSKFDGKFLYNQLGIKVARAKGWVSFSGKVNITELYIDDDKNTVVSDYWHVLSKKAIETSIGVIDLFFREVEKEKKTGVLKARNVSAAELHVKETAQEGFKVVKAFYGSSLDQSDVEDLLNDNAGQAGAAALAVADAPSRPQQNIVSTKPPAPGVIQKKPPQPQNASQVLGVEVSPVDEPIEPVLPRQDSTPPTSATTEPQTNAPASSAGSSGGASGGSPTQATDTSSAATSTDTVALDAAPPSAPDVSISECSASFVTADCTVATTTVTLIWSSISDASYYAIVKDGVILATTTATSTTSNINSAVTTTFSVVAYKQNGLAATSTEKSVFVTTQPLIINEIAWAGTNASAEDEAIELRNMTNSILDLSHFVITNLDGSNIIPLAGTIAATGDSSGHDFFVVERNAQATTAGSPNAITVDFAQLSDGGEQLLLQWGTGTATTTIDTTPPIATCGGWCAGASSGSAGYSVQSGTTTAQLTMERKDNSPDGSLAASWRTADGYTLGAFDRTSSVIYGTLSANNSKGNPGAGWFCSPDTVSVASGAHYTPPSSICTYLMRAVSTQANRYGDLYRGDVASSTLVRGRFFGPVYIKENQSDPISNPQAGEHFFIAIYEGRVGVAFTSPPTDDNTLFRTYFTTGANPPPHSNYYVIPWVYGP